MLTVLENVDFCMAVVRAGGLIYLEPASIVTYAAYAPLALSDIPFYLLRWNNRWTFATLHHLRDKWELTDDPDLRKYAKLIPEWRRRDFLVHATLLRRVPSWMSDVAAARHASRPERVRRIHSWIGEPTTSHAETAPPARP